MVRKNWVYVEYVYYLGQWGLWVCGQGTFLGYTQVWGHASGLCTMYISKLVFFYEFFSTYQGSIDKIHISPSPRVSSVGIAVETPTNVMKEKRVTVLNFMMYVYLKEKEEWNIYKKRNLRILLNAFFLFHAQVSNTCYEEMVIYKMHCTWLQ